jgi:uncharacterized Zn finger protein
VSNTNTTTSPLFDGGRDGDGSTFTFGNYVGKIVSIKTKTAGKKVDMTGSTDSTQNYLLDLDDPEFTITSIADAGSVATGDTDEIDIAWADGNEDTIDDALATVEAEGKVGEAIQRTIAFVPNYIAPDSGDEA